MDEHPASTPVGSLPTEITVSTNKSVFVRLTAMMLFEFAVFGSWFATFGLVLATYQLPAIIGTAYSLAAVAAIIAPMFLGALGDRFIASQKGLAVAHIAGGAVMCLLPTVIQGGNSGWVLALIFVYMLFFQPTLGLANCIALRHLGENQRLFPFIRVFGTIGWVFAGLLVGALGLSESTGLFYVTAALSFAFGLYSFSLPATPPPAKGVRFSLGDMVGAKAFALFHNRNFTVLMICTLLTAISLGVYNTYASPFLGALGIHNVAGVLSLGQAAEVVFVVAIPFTLKYFGMKWGLMAGMFMWACRLSLFVLAITSHNWVAVVGIALQGICTDFFIVLAAMYIGSVTPVQLSAQAQSMLILVISGLGAFIGAFVAGHVYNSTVATQAATDLSGWTPVWIVGIVPALLAAAIWALFFRFSRIDGPQPIVLTGA